MGRTREVMAGKGLQIAERVVAVVMGTLLALRLVLSVTGTLPGFLNSPVDVAVFALFSMLCILLGVDQAKRGRTKHATACFVGAAAWLAFAALILK